VKTDLGADLARCYICEEITTLRFNVCKKCDDAFWLTKMSKKQINPKDHNIYDIQHIKYCIKKYSSIIKDLIKKLDAS